MKTVLMEVTNGGEWEGPSYAWADLDESYKGLIDRLSKGAQSLGVFRVCTFDTGLMWGHMDEEPAFMANGDIRWVLGPRERDLMLIEFRPERVDCPVLNINDDGNFYWTAYVKHSNLRLETATLDLKMFEKKEDEQ